VSLPALFRWHPPAPRFSPCKSILLEETPILFFWYQENDPFLLLLFLTIPGPQTQGPLEADFHGSWCSWIRKQLLVFFAPRLQLLLRSIVGLLDSLLSLPRTFQMVTLSGLIRLRQNLALPVLVYVRVKLSRIRIGRPFASLLSYHSLTSLCGLPPFR